MPSINKTKTPLSIGIELGRKLERQNTTADIYNYAFASLPPHSLELEEAVLGGLIISPSSPESLFVFANLTPQVFYSEKNQNLFGFLIEMQASNQKIDLLTIIAHIKSKGLYSNNEAELINIPTASDIVALTNKVASTANTEAHAKILIEYYKEREMGAICLSAITDMQNKVYQSSNDAAATISEKIQNIVSASTTAPDFKYIDFVNILTQKVQGTYGNLGIASSITMSDGKKPFMVFEEKDMVVIAALSSHGKTAYAITECLNMLINGYRVHFYTLEEGEYQIWSRLVSQLVYIKTGVILPYGDIQKGYLNEQQLQIITDMQPYIDIFKDNLKIFVDSVTIEGIAMNTKIAVTRKAAPDAVFIDQFSLVSHTGGKGNNLDELNHIAKETKAMARNMKIPHFLLAQVGIKLVARGALPTLADIKECSRLVEDSDKIVFVHRKSVEDPTNEDVFLWKAKERGGAIGHAANVKFIGECSLYTNTPQKEKDPFAVPSLPPADLTTIRIERRQSHQKDVPF